jgi:hypothetical protein
MLSLLRRTPSAWFLPTTSRLAIRSSAADNMDLGADTLLDIPINEWVHLSFVFQNLTTTIATSNTNSPLAANEKNVGGGSEGNRTDERVLKRGPYIVSLYVNGFLDVSLTYANNALPNSHPLNLFKDLSHRGTTCYYFCCKTNFMSDVFVMMCAQDLRDLLLIL